MRRARKAGAVSYYSRSVAGFWLKPQWLWRKPLPPVQRILRTIGGPAYLARLNQQLQGEEEI